MGIITSEARAPAGYTHEKPFIYGGRSFVGGQFIPGTSQSDIDKAASSQGELPPEESDQKAKQGSPPQAFDVSVDDINRLLKFGKSSAIYGDMKGAERSLVDLMLELSKKKKRVISFPLEKLSNVDKSGETGDFEDGVPPCIVDQEKVDDDKHDLIVGNDIALFAESKGKEFVPAILADADDKSIEPLLQDRWAKWMYSRIDDTDEKQFEQRKKAVESLSWLDFLMPG